MAGNARCAHSGTARIVGRMRELPGQNETSLRLSSRNDGPSGCSGGADPQQLTPGSRSASLRAACRAGRERCSLGGARTCLHRASPGSGTS
jgi:hypothetical protein